MKKITTSNVLETAWVSKELVFRSEPMDAVLKRIGRKYGVSFEIMDSSLVKDTYTGVFDKEEIEEVIDILKVHYGFDYKIKGNEVQLLRQINRVLTFKKKKNYENIGKGKKYPESGQALRINRRIQFREAM